MLCFAAPIVLWRFDENAESSYRHVWHKAQRQVEEETEAAEAEKKSTHRNSRLGSQKIGFFFHP